MLLIAQDIARGLLHIHSKNIVHGDLSCSNVLLQACPAREPLLSVTAKLADFGLSIRMEDGQSHHSRLFQGTPHYMAPEVLARGSLSKASGAVVGCAQSSTYLHAVYALAGTAVTNVWYPG